MVEGTDEVDREIDNLARSLGIKSFQYANRSVIPRAIVLEIADLFQISLEEGTAENQLEQIIEEAGLVNSRAESLSFKRNQSAFIAVELEKIVRKQAEITASAERKIKPYRAVETSSDFTPAKTKLEAVNRISALTGSGPERLGPGSKERKSVLENLHLGLGFGNPPHETKTGLGKALAAQLDVNWTRKCWSTGQTLTLEGLNRILFGANQYVTSRNTRLPSASTELTPAQEADMYIGVILQVLVGNFMGARSAEYLTWEGRSAVEEMLTADYSNARQTEWPGWFFEFKVIPELIKQFGGGPKKVGSTSFDYYGYRAWDLKTHSLGTGRRSEVILNDKMSTLFAVENGGLGYILLEGYGSYEEEETFYDWHRTEVRGRPRMLRSPNSRKLKTAFTAERLDVYFIENTAHLKELELEGVLLDFNQGRQQDGSLRKAKYRMPLERARLSSALINSLPIGETDVPISVSSPSAGGWR